MLLCRVTHVLACDTSPPDSHPSIRQKELADHICVHKINAPATASLESQMKTLSERQQGWDQVRRFRVSRFEKLSTDATKFQGAHASSGVLNMRLGILCCTP